MLLMIYICCIKYETKGGKASSLSETMSSACGTASSYCLGVAKRGRNTTWTGPDAVTRAISKKKLVLFLLIPFLPPK